MRNKNLFLDIGSTNIKWRVDGGGVKFFPFPLSKKMPSPFFEVSRVNIISIIKNIINSEKCERIFISVQMHGYVIKDLNGKEITDYISWQDRRASLTPITLHLPSVSGTAVKENLPRAGVEAMVKTSEEFNNIKKEFFTLGSYIVYKITGINSTHITDAAASGYYNAFTCETLNSANILLPYATKDFVCLGKYKGMEIFSPVGDQQAAVLGSEAGERDYIINLGTAGQMCCISKDFVSGDFESRPYFDGKTLCTVTELTAGKKMREGGDWGGLFYADFSSAVRRLPLRSRIIVIGGAVKYYRNEIDNELAKMKLPVIYKQDTDALEGLKKLMEKYV